jgi:hypothetical protein
MAGTSTVNPPRVFGTQGVASVSNSPQARLGHRFTGVDGSGSVYVFGGYAVNASSGQTQPVNDLWRLQQLCRPGFTGVYPTCSPCSASSYKEIFGARDSPASILCDCSSSDFSVLLRDAGSASCLVCPASASSLAGATSRLACTCVSVSISALFAVALLNAVVQAGSPGGPCTVCGNNEWSAENSLVCSVCPPNSVSAAGSASLSACKCVRGLVVLNLYFDGLLTLACRHPRSLEATAVLAFHVPASRSKLPQARLPARLAPPTRPWLALPSSPVRCASTRPAAAPSATPPCRCRMPCPA